MDLSIIIVNWNSKEYLNQCIASIFSQTPDIEFEIVVIDNASYDGCEKILHQNYPQVKFIQSHKNKGFAKANNEAFCVTKGQNLLFLNPDTELNGTAIQNLQYQLRNLPVWRQRGKHGPPRPEAEHDGSRGLARLRQDEQGRFRQYEQVRHELDLGPDPRDSQAASARVHGPCTRHGQPRLHVQVLRQGHCVALLQEAPNRGGQHSEGPFQLDAARRIPQLQPTTLCGEQGDEATQRLRRLTTASSSTRRT